VSAAAHSEAYAEKLAVLVARLGDAVNRETKLIATRRPNEIERFKQEREQLTAAYERGIEYVKANPSLLKGADAGTVTKLKQAMARFHELLNEHRRAVFAAKTLTERLIGAITEEVARRERPLGGYTRNATIRTAPQRATRPVSLALNQVV
jgi:hypothetical protein